MQWMKMAHSFLQSESNLLHYHFKFCYVVLHMAVKEFLKLTSKNGEIGHFDWSLLKESFHVTMKFHSYIPSNIKVCAEFSFTPHIYCFIWIQDIFSAVINTVRANKKSFKALDMNSAAHCN